MLFLFSIKIKTKLYRYNTVRTGFGFLELQVLIVKIMYNYKQLAGITQVKFISFT